MLLWSFFPVLDFDEIISIPSLCKLTLFDVNVGAMKTLHKSRVCGTSSTTHLALVPASSRPIRKEVLMACLRLPRSLISLTLHLPHECSEHDPLEDDPPSCVILNDELWQSFVSTSKVFSILIFMTKMPFGSSSGSRRETPHLGLLSELKCLRTLRIQLQVLLGGTCGILGAPFQLHDILPQSLHALFLYTFFFQRSRP